MYSKSVFKKHPSVEAERLIKSFFRITYYLKAISRLRQRNHRSSLL